MIEKGEDLLHAAVAAGVYINSSCGGDGVCGRCRVIVKRGEVTSEPTGRLSEEEKARGYCLACRTTVGGDVEVEIPPESRLEEEQILTEEAKASRLVGLYSQAEEIEVIPEEEGLLLTHSPLATKLYLELPPPTLQDNISDLERLHREIRRNRDIPIMQAGLANVKRLGRLFREANWQVTVTLGKRNGTVEIVLIEPGDTSNRNYGVAVDVGTTTVAAQLINVNTRQILGTKATHNTQASYGEDVISRIIYASEKDGLEKLHHAVIDNINSLILRLAEENGISLSDITAIMCAGNMTMTHLLLRVDPTYLRREPYVPTANFVPVIRASEAGIKVNPRGLLSCLPGVSSYVGGDITAGTLASGMADSEDLSMLIDIGTNGEIVLGNRDWLVCCSSSAGPAFEGCGVKSGMRAVKGAIQKLEIDPSNYEVKYITIGNVRPRGICGSGLIDGLSELLKAGVIDRSGKMKKDIKTERMREREEGPEFVLAWEKEVDGQRDIVIMEADITNLIRSKGAIYAGAAVLARSMGLKFSDLEGIFIAGGFGNYMNIEKAILIGLLPDISLDRIHFIGNSSLTGARRAILSYEALNKVKEIAHKMTYFELSVDPRFMDEYTGALFLPHTDMELFPSVKKKLKL